MDSRIILKGMNLAKSAGGLICLTCRGHCVARTLTLVVVLLFLGVSSTPLNLEAPAIRATEDSSSEANIVTWNVGDTWHYDIELDAVNLVEGSSDLSGSSLDLVSGDATLSLIHI